VDEQGVTITPEMQIGAVIDEITRLASDQPHLQERIRQLRRMWDDYQRGVLMPVRVEITRETKVV